MGHGFGLKIVRRNDPGKELESEIVKLNVVITKKFNKNTLSNIINKTVFLNS